MAATRWRGAHLPTMAITRGEIYKCRCDKVYVPMCGRLLSTFLIWQVVEPITMDEASAIDARVSSDNLVSARLSDGSSFS